MTEEQKPSPSPTDEFGFGGAASAAEEAAAHWLMRMTSGETTPDERAEFARWRQADPAHEAALAALRGLWTHLGPLLESARPARSTTRAPARPRWRRARLWALAASLVLGVTLGYQGLKTWRYDEVTAAGERRSFMLDDGSQISLNSGTAMDLHLGPRLREISIARGEALFEVAHDATRPFVVKAGDSQTRVLGTRFSVRRDDDDVRVIVLDGRVEVRNGEQVSVLTAGQQIASHEQVLSDIVIAHPEIDLSWRQGRLVMRDAALSDIVAELRRYRAAPLIVANSQLGQRRFNAVIDLDHIDDWLHGLDQTGSIQVTRLGPVVLIH